jgi:hypothetical protein
VISQSLNAEEEHLPLIGRVVLQGLVFTWACESRALLKVQHPQYGTRIVPLDRHYEPEILAKLTALGMVVRGAA